MKYRPEYDAELIGGNLKRLRLAKNLSVIEVQKYLRLGTRQAIYKYESGKGYPQADTLLALMELYGADLHDIIDKHRDEQLFYEYESVTLLKQRKEDHEKRVMKYRTLLLSM